MQYHSWYITGASSGIGEAFARAAPPDTHLLLSGRDEKRLSQITREIGPLSSYCAGDLTSDIDRQAAIDKAKERNIDLLILNAGIGKFGPVLENSFPREQEMIRLNIEVPLEMIHALAPGMIDRAQQSGRRAGIILVSSLAGFMPIPYFATYAATKSFLQYFGEAFAHELRDLPLDCLVLCPGTTETRFFERAEAQKMLTGSYAMNPGKVAKDGLRFLGQKSIHVVGWHNRWLSRIIGRLPHGLMIGAAARIMKNRL